jgi:hypothetical protein
MSILKEKDVVWTDILRDELYLMCLALGKEGYGLNIWILKYENKK